MTFKYKVSLLALMVSGLSYGAIASTELPKPQEPFKGQINLTWKDSKPDFPKQPQAKKGAPNILLIMTDDVGPGAASTFGGPVNTPVFTALAREGVRYNQFHTTALSSPTRAALLTGRNHHQAHTGNIMETGRGYPGYDTLLGPDTVTIAEVLRQNGYSTAWFGKNHNVPDFETDIRVGPFERWPLWLGFEKFYGFIGAESSQYVPAIYDGITPVNPYIDKPDYTLNEDLADQTIRWIKEQKSVSPDKPFFAYYVPGATHAPHQVPAEWSDKYKGKFDKGWDKVREETLANGKKIGVIPQDTKLTERPKEIPAWESLSDTEKKVYAREMEIYAGFLEQTDHHIGRVIDSLREIGELDNTIIIYIQGDNGASGEGAMPGSLNENVFFNVQTESIDDVAKGLDKLGTNDSYNHYSAGWAHAMGSPFQWMKQVASHFGGTRNNVVVSWPKHIKEKGGLRSQFHHVTDIMPTLLEIAQVEMPYKYNGVEQKQLDGVSMTYSFNNAKAPTNHTTQYFEIFGYQGIYHDGWIAAATPKMAPWLTGHLDGPNASDKWELYDIRTDFSEANDLAAKYPEKLNELKELFTIEAAKNNVFPMYVNSTTDLPMLISNRIDPTHGRTQFVYWTDVSRVPEANGPDFKNKSFTIEADVTFDKGVTPNGMLLTMGGRFAGFGFWLEDGKVVFGYANPKTEDYKEIMSAEKVGDGRHVIKMTFKSDFEKTKKIGAGGEAKLYIDGKLVATGRIDKTIPARFTLTEYLDIGQDYGTTISPRYKPPFKLNGKVNKVTVDTKPKL
ncbi:MAG: sulfatase-like hydrolase/transferase [Lactobacillales bacterium]|jgi:arylsulfatase|nr:sulfatase-like hydrolase/transferase [Lactobacillales bacterium]